MGMVKSLASEYAAVCLRNGNGPYGWLVYHGNLPFRKFQLI